MRVFAILALGTLAVLMLTGRLGLDIDGTSVPKPQEAAGGVNDVFEKTLEAGQPAKPGTAAAKLNNQCAFRERRLTAIARPRSLTAVPAYALRVLAVLQAHSRRASEPPEVRAFDLEHQRIVQRVAHAAGRGDYRKAQDQALALRELAGRANVTFMRLGLTNCVLRGTSMPL